MEYKIRFKQGFSAAHILNMDTKCGRIHGHNYEAYVELISEFLFNGMVADFIPAKDIVKRLDHKFIITKNQVNEIDGDVVNITANKKDYAIPYTDVIILDIEESTAELIAQDIANEMRIAFPIKSVTVELSETENNTAEVTL